MLSLPPLVLKTTRNRCTHCTPFNMTLRAQCRTQASLTSGQCFTACASCAWLVCRNHRGLHATYTDAVSSDPERWRLVHVHRRHILWKPAGDGVLCTSDLEELLVSTMHNEPNVYFVLLCLLPVQFAQTNVLTVAWYSDRCRVWVERPVVLFNIPFAFNFYHYICQGVAGIVYVLQDCGLLPQHLARCLRPQPCCTSKGFAGPWMQ